CWLGSMAPFLTSKIPPTSEPLSSPPNTFPEIETPIDWMAMIGNWPWSSRLGWIWMPLTAPERVSPATAGSPVMLADRLRLKVPGWVWIALGHETPMLLIRIGSQLGQPRLEPEVEPTLRVTPNAALGLFGSPGSKVPSGAMPKFCAEPPMVREPIF